MTELNTCLYGNYSSKHKTIGRMDFFKNPIGTNANGLQYIIIRAGLSTLKGLSCKLDLHIFSLRLSHESQNGDDSKIINAMEAT